ncbi:MAG: hypothetical protein DMG89_03590 [Acidobacteria bacterium]|nr:MAG: hypothetical protein DMG89_03590 [Acidobacteriota bacterium]
MATSNFQVNVPPGFSNPDPQNLSDTEKSAARVMGLSEEQFRQSKVELFRADERRRERGYELGKEVEKILKDLGAGYRLTSITWNSNTLSWRLEIETPQAQQNVVLAWDLVDQVLDSMTHSELQRLRNMVWFGLGRRDLIFEKHE